MIFTTAGIYVGFCKKGGTDIHSIRIPVVGAIYNHHDLTKYQVLFATYYTAIQAVVVLLVSSTT